MGCKAQQLQKTEKKESDKNFAEFALSNSSKLLSNFPAMIKANKLGLRVLSIKVDKGTIHGQDTMGNKSKTRKLYMVK